MKLGRKTLSVLLSFLMAFSACTVCLSGLAVTAGAVSVSDDIRNVQVNSNKETNSATAYSYTGDNGDVLNAVKEILTSARQTRGNGEKAQTNSPDTLLPALFGSDTSSNAYNLASKVLLTGYAPSDYHNWAGLTGKKDLASSTKSDTGTDIINRCGEDVPGIVGLNDKNSSLDLGKQITVNVDRNLYILNNIVNKNGSFDDLKNTPTRLNASLNIKARRTATVTSVSEEAGCFGSTNYTMMYTYNCWTYYTNISAPSITTTNEYFDEMSQIKAFFDTYMSGTEAEFYHKCKSGKYNLDEVVRLANNIYSVMSKYKVNVTGVSPEIIVDFLIGKDAFVKIEDRVNLINRIQTLFSAQDNIDALSQDIRDYEQINPTADSYKTTDGAYMTRMGVLLASSTREINYLNTVDSSIFDDLKNIYAPDDTDVAAFTIDAVRDGAANIKRTYYLNKLYNHILTADDYIARNSDYINALYEKFSTFVKSEDIIQIIDADSTTALVTMSNMMKDLASQMLVCKNKLTDADYTSLVTSDVQSRIDFFTTRTNDLINAGVQEKTLIKDYLDKKIDTYIFEDYAALSTSNRCDHLIAIAGKQSDMNNKFDTAQSNMTDKTLAKNIFTLSYYGENLTLKEAVQKYIDILFESLTAEVYPQLENLDDKTGNLADENKLVITMSTYFIIKDAKDNVNTDVLDKLIKLNYVDNTHTNLYDKYKIVAQKLLSFRDNGGYAVDTVNYEPITRKATGSADSKYLTDLLRYDENDDYVADAQRVNTSIAKLDSVLVTTPITSMLISPLVNKVVSNNLVNTLVGTIYPLVESICNEKAVPLLKKLIEAKGALREPADENADLAIDVSVLKDSASGIVDAYVNGNGADGNTSKTFVELFRELGIYATATDFVDNLPDKYKNIKEFFADNYIESWDELKGDDGKISLDFDWGVKDFDSLIDALTVALSGIEPLLRVLLTDYNLTAKLENVIYGKSSTINYKVDINDVQAWIYLPINIKGLNLYSKVVVPLLTALGEKNPATITASSSLKEIFTAIVKPIQSVLTQLNKKPIDTVLSLLPNLVHFLSIILPDALDNDLVINANPATVGLYIIAGSAMGLVNLDNLDLTDNSKHSFVFGLVTIGPYSPFEVIKEPLNLGPKLLPMVGEKLGIDLSSLDLNVLLSKLLGSLIGDVKLPMIDEGKLMSCTTVQDKYFVADKAAELKLVYDYVVNKCLGDKTIINGLLGKFGFSLPDSVDDILNNIRNNGDDVFAMLVEMFNPQDYKLDTFKWKNYDRLPSYELADGVTDWTDERAGNVMNNLTDALNAVMRAAGKQDIHDLDKYLNDTVLGLFTGKTLGKIATMLKALSDKLSGQGALVSLVNRLLDTDLLAYSRLSTGFAVGSTLYTLKDGELFSNGEKIDSTNFAKSLTDLFTPVRTMFDLCLEGKDHQMVSGNVVFRGNNGIENGLNYVFEMLGAEKVKTTGNSLNDLTTAFNSVVGFATEKIEKDGAVNYICELLPRVVAFVDSNGLSVVLKNVFHPVLAIIDLVRPAFDIDINKLLSCVLTGLIKTGNIDVDTLKSILLGGSVPDFEYKLDIQKIDLDTVLTLVDRLIGTSFATGSLATKGLPQMSANIKDGDYSKQNDVTDTFMILIGAIVDSLLEKTPDGLTNGDKIVSLLSSKMGEKAENVLNGNSLADVYKIVVDVLSIKEPDPMQSYDWAYLDKADTGEVISPFTESSVYGNPYGKYWTRKDAVKLEKNLIPLIENVMCLLGLEYKGQRLDSIAEVISDLPADYLYTQAVVDKVKSLIDSVLAKLNGLDFAPEAKRIIKNAIHVDLDAYANMKFTVTDEKSFKASLVDMLNPLLPVLNCLLCDEDISFFYSYNGDHIITIPGSEGYAFGLVPILEALGCKNIPTVDEFKQMVKSSLDNNDKKAVESVVNLLTSRVDEIAADPINGIKSILPSVLYFLNSNGLVTAINNAAVSIDTILKRVYPLFSDKPLTVQGFINVDLSKYTADGIANMLVEMLNKKLALDLKAPAIDLLTELSNGVVKSYTSINGQTYYTMEYAAQAGQAGDSADTMTAILRVIFAFVAQESNREQLKAFINEKITNETAAGVLVKLLDEIGSSIKDDKSMGLTMKIFNEFLLAVAKAVDEVDASYHDVSNTWGFAIKMLQTSSDPFLSTLGDHIVKYLNGNVDPDIINPSGVATNGFMKFFEALKEFFNKIINFFKNLFKIA